MSRRKTKLRSKAIHQIEFLEPRQLLSAASANLPAADAPTQITDDDNPAVTYIGNWWSSQAGAGYIGDDFRNDGNQLKGQSSARFPLNIASDGVYSVFARWPSISFNRPATNAVFDITTSTGVVTIFEDETANTGQWVLLGNFALSASSAAVTVRNNDADGVVLADAVGTASTTDVITQPPPPPPPASLIVDDDDPGVSYVGNWWSSQAGSGYYAGDFRNDGNQLKGHSSVTFTPQLSAAGTYTVSMRWPSAIFGVQASNVPVDIVTSAGTVTVIVDQSRNAGQWVSLGDFVLNPATVSVRIRNDDTAGLVAADAISFNPNSTVQTQLKSFTFPANISSAGRYSVSAHFPAAFSPPGTVLSVDLITVTGKVSTTVSAGGDVNLGTFEFDPATAAVIVHDTGDNVPDTVSFTPATPLAPTNFAGAAFSPTEIDLSWMNNSPSASLSLQYGTDAGDQTSITLPAGTSSYHAVNLTPGGIYTFTLQTIQNSLMSAAVSLGHIQTSFPSPPAPGTFIASVISSTEVDLSWANDDAAASLVLQYTTGNSTQRQSLATLPAGTSTYAATGLSPGAAYTFFIHAVDHNLASTDQTAGPVQTPLAPPAAPSNLAATAVSDTQINLTWTDNVINASYSLQIVAGGSLTTIPLPLNAISYSATGLTPSTIYTFTLRAVLNNLSSSPVTRILSTQASPAVTFHSELVTSQNGFEIYDIFVDGLAGADASAGPNGVGVTSVNATFTATTGAFLTPGSTITSLQTDTTDTGGDPLSAAGAISSAANYLGTTYVNMDVALGFSRIGQDPTTSDPHSNTTTSFQAAYGILAGSYLGPSTLSGGPGSYFGPDRPLFAQLIVTAGGAGVFAGTVYTAGGLSQDYTVPFGHQPGAPSSFMATVASATEVNLSWTNNAPGAILVLDYAAGNAAPAPLATLTPDTTSYAATGLEPGTLYSFFIHAAQGPEISATVASPTIQTPVNPPPAPQNFTAHYNVGDGYVDLTWANLSPLASLILKYTSNFGDSSSITLPPGTQQHSFSLDPLTTYTFSLQAIQNGVGSDIVTIAPIETPPALADNFSITVVSMTEVDLSWHNRSPGASTDVSYNIGDASLRDPFDSLQVVHVGVFPPDVNSLAITGLTPRTLYEFSVTPVQDGLSAGPTLAVVETPFPELQPPTNLSAVAISPSEIKLTWTNNPLDNGVYISYTPDGGSATTVKRLGGLATFTTYTLTNLNPNTHYTINFRTLAEDALSLPASIDCTTMPPPKADFDVTLVASQNGYDIYDISITNLEGPDAQPGVNGIGISSMDGTFTATSGAFLTPGATLAQLLHNTTDAGGDDNSDAGRSSSAVNYDGGTYVNMDLVLALTRVGPDPSADNQHANTSTSFHATWGILAGSYLGPSVYSGGPGADFGPDRPLFAEIIITAGGGGVFTGTLTAASGSSQQYTILFGPQTTS